MDNYISCFTVPSLLLSKTGETCAILRYILGYTALLKKAHECRMQILQRHLRAPLNLIAVKLCDTPTFVKVLSYEL
jgi:hypothetical protein